MDDQTRLAALHRHWAGRFDPAPSRAHLVELTG